MEPNTKSVVVVNDLFGQLKLNVPTEGGPINQLPNEMMLLVLDRVNLDGDVKKLVRLRLVTTRWNWLIEHYCKQNKSLIVNGENFFTSDLNNSGSQIVSLKSADFFGTLLELFPNIEQLVIGEYFRGGNGSRFYPSEDTKIRDFAAKINSFSSLKRLELERNDLKVLPHLSQTLSRLEYIRVKRQPAQRQLGFYTEMNQFISHLGSSCVRVVFGYYPDLVYRQVREWHKINPSWLANLTHLEFCTEWDGEDEDGVQILNYLSKHSTRLQTLKYMCFNDNDPLKMTPTLIGALGNLTNLNVLKLWNIEMDIPELDRAASQHRITSLSSVLDCELCIFDGFPGTADQFTRVLSAIFPNLTNLNLEIVENFSDDRQFLSVVKLISVLDCELYISEGRPTKGDKFTRVLSTIFPSLNHLRLDIDEDFSDDRQFLSVVKQNVHRFPNLRKHEIDFWP